MSNDKLVNGSRPTVAHCAMIPAPFPQKLNTLSAFILVGGMVRKPNSFIYYRNIMLLF